jgi:hypothetical protein
VLDKEKANFCDYFKPCQRDVQGVKDTREDLKSAAEALFKKK